MTGVLRSVCLFVSAAVWAAGLPTPAPTQAQSLPSPVGPELPPGGVAGQANTPARSELLPPGTAATARPLPSGGTESLPPGISPESILRQEVIRDVRVFGNQTVTMQKIGPLIKTRPGRPFDPQMIEEDVRRLTKSRLFISVDPVYQRSPEGGLVVIFRVVERPTLAYVKYIGSSVRDKTLAKQTSLKVGDAMDPYAVSEARRKLEEYLLTKGWGKVKVTVIEGDKPGDRGAVFLINEGQKQKIFKIEFVGNTIASDARLRTQIKSKVPILYLFKGDVDRAKIDSDVDKLTTYYRGLGFFRARIGRELEFNEKENWLTLTFVIDEGPRYKIRDVSIVGNRKFAAEQLSQKLKLKNGDYFDQGGMTKDVAALQDEYGGAGYIFSKVEADTRFLEEPGQVDLVYQVQEGARYRIGRIEVRIEGENPRTRRHTVMNRLSFQTGDIADIREIRDSERRLKGSGLFANNPADGNAPRIVFEAPDLQGEQTSVASANGGGFRGQSPDGAEPVRVLNLVIDVPQLRDDAADEPPRVVRAQSPDGGTATPPAHPATVARPIVTGGYRSPTDLFPDAPPASPLRPTVPVVRGQSPGSAVGAGQVPIGRTNPDAVTTYATPARQPVTVAQQTSPPNNPLFGPPAVPSVTSPAPAYTTPNYGTPTYGTPNYGNQPGLPAYGAPPTATPTYSPPASTAPGYSPPAYAPPNNAAPAYGTPSYGSQPGLPAYGSPPATGGIAPGALPPAGSFAPGTYAPGTYGAGGAPPAPLGATATPVPPAAFGSPGTVFTEEPTRDVNVITNVTETTTGRFMLGVGVNSNAGLLGNIVIDEQNFDIRRLPRSVQDIFNGTAFRGGGQQFRVEAVPGSQVSRYSINFREPYLFDTRINFGVSGFYFNRFYQNWTEQRLGGRASFGYQLTPDLSSVVALRAEDVGISNPTTPTPNELSSVIGHNGLFTVQVNIAHDTRDSAFLPTSGHYVNLGYEQAFGQFDYPRGTIDARQYFLLRERPDRSGRHTLALISELGFSGNDTPIFENFFAGGYGSLRGFYFRGAEPLSLGVQIGGQFQWLNTVEYMFPITADDMIRGVVFCDFGTVERSVELHANSFRVAPGAGLRITVPAMGPAPIALDFSAPVNHMPGDHIQNFSFSVGVNR